MRWTVVQVAEAMGVAPPSGLDPLAWLAGVSIDSRAVGPGELFIAIRGPRHDGHGFVAGALAGGAAAGMVASDAVPGKPIALINAAPRAFHAQAALRETLATMAARLAPEAFVTLPLTGRTVVASEIAADSRLAKQLREGLDALVAAISTGLGSSALTPL